MTKKTEKEFDCVAMKRAAALRIHETLKGMTKEEELAYWRRVDQEADVKYPLLQKLNVSVSRHESDA